MLDPQKQRDAEATAARERFQRDALCKLHGVTEMSDAAFFKARDAALSRIKTRDAATRDAASALYEPSPKGGLRARFRPGLSDNDLPAYVSQVESALISEGFGFDEPNSNDWQVQGDEEGDIAAIRRLNAAHAQRYAAWGEGSAPNLTEPERAYYAGPGEGHPPGDPPVAGPNARRYGTTGEGTFPEDYLSANGADPVAETRSPPPPRTDPNSAYLRAVSYFADEPTPLSSGPALRVGAERDLPGQRPNRRPFIASAYPSGPSPQITEQASYYAVNFGVATPNRGDPDNWTRQRGANPDRFDTLREARNRAGDEAVRLRALNRLHHRHYGRRGG